MIRPWWYDILATVPYVGWSTLMLIFAGVFMLIGRVWHKVWYGMSLVFIWLAVFFFSLPISAGSSPIIPRASLAVPVRMMMLFGLVVAAWAVYALARRYIRIEWRMNDVDSIERGMGGT